MLMKKFLGATAREAMQRMKAELGPDALVISNRNTGAGVEILAMVEAGPAMLHADPDLAAEVEVRPPQPQHAAARAQAQKPGAAPNPPAATAVARAGFTSLKDFARRIETPSPRAAPAASEPRAPQLHPNWHVAKAYGVREAVLAPAALAPAPALREAAPQAPVAAPAPWPQGHSRNDQRMFEELSAMRSMLQCQIAGQTWRDMAERRPLAVRLWRELVEAPAVSDDDADEGY